MIDLDRDGWLDVALLNLSAPRVRLLRNRIGDRAAAQGNGYVALRMVGGNRTAQPSKAWSSRDGIGAQIELKLEDGTIIYRALHTEDGFMTQHTATQLIGIGARKRVESITVRWPSGRTQTRDGVSSGSLVTVYENAAESPSRRAFHIEPYSEQNNE